MAAGLDTQITELAPSDHACLTFGDREELLDLTAAFLRDGLVAGAKVLWVTDMLPSQAVAELSGRGVAVDQALACGQLVAVIWEDSLLCDQGFVAERAVGWLSGQVAACRAGEFPGLRVAVDMGWALRPVPGVEQLPDMSRPGSGWRAR